VRFLLQFNNPLIYILLVSSFITAVLKDAVDAVVIFGVVFVNAVIGYVKSPGRAGHAGFGPDDDDRSRRVARGKTVRLEMQPSWCLATW